FVFFRDGGHQGQWAARFGVDLGRQCGVCRSRFHKEPRGGCAIDCRTRLAGEESRTGSRCDRKLRECELCAWEGWGRGFRKSLSRGRKIIGRGCVARFSLFYRNYWGTATVRENSRQAAKVNFVRQCRRRGIPSFC